MRTSPLRTLIATAVTALAIATVPVVASGAPAEPSSATSGPVAQDISPTYPIPGFKDVGLGRHHSCGLANDDVVFCWGQNTNGQLGTGTTDRSMVPAVVVGGPLAEQRVDHVGVGYHHNCAVTADGVLACWGQNTEGQLGVGEVSPYLATPTPVKVAGTALEGEEVEQVVAGTVHTCALTADDVIACWGWGSDGQLGHGKTTNSSDPVPVQVDGTPLDGKRIDHIAAGGENTCAVADDSTIACWGDNGWYQLGNDGDSSSVPVAVTTAGTPLEGERIAQVVVAGRTVCALGPDVLACWGEGSDGEIGDGSGSDAPLATAVTTAGTPLEGQSLSQLTAGTDHLCARTKGGVVACWGKNSRGKIGDGTIEDALVPTGLVVAGTPLDAAAIRWVAAGDGHTCAIPSDGDVACWGAGTSGKLGDGDSSDSLTPVAVEMNPVPPAAPTVTSVTPGQGSVVVTYDPPAPVNELEISEYTVRWYVGGLLKGSAVAGPGSHLVDSLAVGIAHRFTVAAHNQVGEGPESTLSDPVVPLGSAPSIDGVPYVPITPCRIVDTRQAGGALGNREIRDVAVIGGGGAFAAQGGTAGGCGIPANAVAVEASITAVGPADSGFFRAWPAGESMPNATFMNFDRGMDITNTGSITIAPAEAEQLRIRNFGGSSHYVIDIQGHYPSLMGGAPVEVQEAQEPGEAAAYAAITPCRIVDTRQAGGALGNREIRDVAVIGGGGAFAAQGGTAGGCGIPANAVAVEASITAVGPADSGFFRAWPAGESMPNATFMNFDRGMDITNTGSITIAPAEAEQLRIRNFGGSSHYVIDIQGAWLPTSGAGDATSSPGAATNALGDPTGYVPITPCRIVDTRQAGGALGNREIRDVAVIGGGGAFAAQGGTAGGCGIPANAVAVEASITAVGPADSGFFRAWPAGESMPNATFMNFDRGMDITNTGSITIAPAEAEQLRIRSFGGSSHYVIDIQGYYPSLAEM